MATTASSTAAPLGSWCQNRAPASSDRLRRRHSRVHRAGARVVRVSAWSAEGGVADSHASDGPARARADTSAFLLRASLAASPVPLAEVRSDPDASSNAFDVVVWGATGFTGSLVARHLAKHAPAGLRWAVGGRSEAKLCSLVGGMVERGEAQTLVPMLMGDAADADDMVGLAHVTRCVVSAAGPYGPHGDVLVGACAATGTHYADLTGEPGWMRRMIDAHDAAARQSGALIVPCSGFDSVPADVGSVKAAVELTARHPGAKVTSVTTYLTKVLGGFSGGTLGTGWRLAEDPVERESFCDVDGLVPGADTSTSRAQTPLAFSELEPTYDADLQAYATLSPFAPCDTKVVRRSVALLNERDGRGVTDCPYASLGEFCYEGKLAAFELGTPVGWASAKVTASLVEAAVRGAAKEESRQKMKEMLPKPGEGPPEWFRELGFWEMRFKAEGTKGEKTWTVMRGKGDPGYADTSRILAEVGVLLATEGKEGGTLGGAEGGVLTPAAAFGDKILPRLERHGITYEVDGESPRGVWFSLPTL